MSKPVARLIERRGAVTIGVHELDVGSFTVGRGGYVEFGSGQADLRLRHRDVSRRHAELEISAFAATIRDLDSKNGVRVDGRPVSAPTPLTDGAQILLGELELVFEHPGARLDAVLRRNGEATVHRQVPSHAEPRHGSEGGLLGPSLAAWGFVLLFTALLVWG